MSVTYAFVGGAIGEGRISSIAPYRGGLADATGLSVRRTRRGGSLPMAHCGCLGQ